MANLLADLLAGSEDYLNNHKWPFGVSLLVSGLLSWAIGSWLANAETEILVNKKTGEETTVGPNHTFFFIKMHWWGQILLALGVVQITLDVMK